MEQPEQHVMPRDRTEAHAMPCNSRFQTGSFFLIERVVLDSVRQFPEHALVTFALVAWTGFDQSVVAYDRRMRVGGRSGWTFAQMLNTAHLHFAWNHQLFS